MNDSLRVYWEMITTNLQLVLLVFYLKPALKYNYKYTLKGEHALSSSNQRRSNNWAVPPEDTLCLVTVQRECYPQQHPGAGGKGRLSGPALHLLDQRLRRQAPGTCDFHAC